MRALCKCFILLMLIACNGQAAPDDPKSSNKLKVGDRLPAPAAPVSTASQAKTPRQYREIKWDELIPPDWNPARMFEKLDLSKLEDSDPRAQAALAQMRKAWDEAPVNAGMNGQAVRIPGFIVPLEGGQKLREFLLVPYFGACIHVPPPPANQIIHVRVAKPLENVGAMDAVWVNGVLAAAYSTSEMGNAGYRMEAEKVEAYQWQ